jgi:hypothetical protein
MDLPLGGGLGPELPLGREVTLLIASGADLSLTLVGVEEAP